MKMFQNEMELFKELDNFIYKSKSLQGSFLRDELITTINEFLETHNLNKNQHDFVDLNKIECQHRGDARSNSIGREIYCLDCGSRVE